MGSRGGMALNINTPQGPMRITIPMNIQPNQTFQVAVPIQQVVVQQPRQATVVAQANYVQQPQQPQQPQRDDASRLIPDMARAMARNGRDYLEIRNAVQATIAPSPLLAHHKQLIQQIIQTEQNATVGNYPPTASQQQTYSQQQLPSPQYARVVQPTSTIVQQSASTTSSSSSSSPTNLIATQLQSMGYSREMSVAAAARNSSVEAAMEWISIQERVAPVVVTASTKENENASSIGRHGRLSFSDAMNAGSGNAQWANDDDKNLPSAPPLF